MTLQQALIFAGIISAWFAVDYIYRRQRCPLPKSIPYGRDTCLRKDGDTVMLYRLRNPHLRWWQKLYLPLVAEADAYWFATPADAQQRERYEHSMYVAQSLVAGGV